ncbi:clasp N terminal-domain-containing protein [Aspergillus coremiiformis]|uniref:Clasp N terminal-domain-containing protein n=1 Tax=Aspergillus coremiiformis TaxID=138285 RepID=A0A5N6ZFW7_9EURO|nr:clasp N terminal-domain-containing protein [Aspergillus coremiiformis]
MEFYSFFTFVTEITFCLWIRVIYLVSPFHLSIQLACKIISTLDLILILCVKIIKHLLIHISSFILYVIGVVTRLEHLLESTMEPKAAELLAVLKNNNLAIDVKVGHLLGIKSDIKQKNVPDGAVNLIFECLRLAIASPHSALYAAGFSTLGHFLKRLFIQDQIHVVSAYARYLYPVLLERLGDHKERVRAQAAQTFTDLWPAAGPEVEHHVLEVALTGKNPKAKEMSLIWLSNMSKNHGLLFRSYVPSLVSCLEDADSVVRDTAKSTTVELFQNAPARAKSDLMKEMTTQNVRKSIVNAIITNIGLEDHSSTARPLSRTDARPASRVESHHHPPRPHSRVEVVHQRSAAVVASHIPIPPVPPREVTPVVMDSEPIKSRPGSSKSEQERITPVPADAGKPSSVELARPSSQDGEEIKPLHAESSKQVDELFRVMFPCFEGRESEDNWMHREKYINTLHRLLYGNAPHEHPQHFYAGVKSILDGIFKAVNSLRTTLSTSGCLLIQDLAKVGGPKLDPMVEIIMQNLIKLCGGMKKISAQNGNFAFNAVLANVTYTPRILHHVTSACQDKNVQLRLYAAGWLKTLINKQAYHKSTIEHGGGLDLLEKSMKKGLSDANPGVREAVRGAFWTFYRVWPAKGNNILSDLDNKTRSLLEKDPANPNRDQTASQNSSIRKGLTGNSTTSSRSALKEAIAAQKKARLAPARALPPRPESAQSSFCETKSSDLPVKPSAVRTVPTGAPISSLSSAPMRPGAKPRRPELARPATADPYASRRPGASDTRPKTPAPPDSSPRPKYKPGTPSKPLSVARTRPKADLGQVASSQKSKPKKLDIPMKAQCPFPIVDPPRSGFNQGLSDQPWEPPHITTSSGVSGRPESPASIQLESPCEHVEQPATSIMMQGASSGPSITASPSHNQAMSSNRGRPRDIGAEATNHLSSSGDGQPEVATTHGGHVTTRHETDVLPGDIDHHEYNSRPNLQHGGESQNTVVIHEDPIPAQHNAEHHANDIVNHEQHMHADVQAENKTQDHEIELPLAVDGANGSNSKDNAHCDTESQFSWPSLRSYPDRNGPVGLNGSPFPSDLLQSTPDYLLNPMATTSNTSNNENKIPTTPITKKHDNLVVSERVSSKNNALGELPSNEPDHRHNKAIDSLLSTPRIYQHSGQCEAQYLRLKNRPVMNKRRYVSPRSQQLDNAKEMVRVAGQRIRSNALDLFAYRKLQDIIHFHGEKLFNQMVFDDLYHALLEELQSESDPKRKHHGSYTDLKTQAVVTFRLLHSSCPNFFVAYYSQALNAIFHARRYFESHCWVVEDLEQTASELFRNCELPEFGGLLDTLVGYAYQEKRDERGYRSILMALSLLTDLMEEANQKKNCFSSDLLEQIGSLAAKDLLIGPTAVRRQVTQVCVKLHAMTGNANESDESIFWKYIGNPKGATRNLVAYYIARQE